MPKSYKLVFRRSAEIDLEDLYDLIADRSGPAVAGGYLDRIEAACLQLTMFPERGRARNDIQPGLRTIGFERAVIVFQVRQESVLIVRVLYGGRDLEPLLDDLAIR